MFVSPEDRNISAEEINRICEELYAEANKRAHETCHDCGVKPGKKHLAGCDISHCDKHGGQSMICGCKPKDKWTGLWPGYQWCYDNKVICYDTSSACWRFDLNTHAIKGR